MHSLCILYAFSIHILTTACAFLHLDPTHITYPLDPIRKVLVRARSSDDWHEAREKAARCSSTHSPHSPLSPPSHHQGALYTPPSHPPHPLPITKEDCTAWTADGPSRRMTPLMGAISPSFDERYFTIL
jgi:hypothetical protein